jgi:hypothetical protein
MAEQTLREKITLRQKKMECIREDYNDLWESITRLGNPRREDIRDDDKTNLKGRRKGKSVYDGTALGSLNIWADGMQGFLLSGSWFRSEMDNPELNDVDAVRSWLQAYDRKMYAAFERSNYYAIVAEWFRDAGSVGTATIYTEEDIAGGKAVHIVVHPREIWIAENQSGEVDTTHRKFMMTARQMEQKFGIENLSSMAKQNAEKEPDKEHEILHAVFPNDDRMAGKRTSKNKEFRSVYLETQSGGAGDDPDELRDSGFDINPYAVWRFRKSSDEIYGYSPMADAIVEIFSLNQFGRTRIEYAHKSVSPAMNVPIEMRGRVRNEPNGSNYYDDPKRVISQIALGGNYPVSREETLAIQESVKDKFRVKFFQAFIGRQGEATREEIIQIKNEQAGLMIAQTDRVYVEGIRRIFDIVSDIEDRRGAFSEEQGMPPIPDEILESGGTINFVLTGPLRQAQRRITELNPIIETNRAIAEAAEVLQKPEMLDVINGDLTAEAIAEAGFFPQKLINSKDVRAQIREDRAAAAAEQRQQEMLLEAAKAVPVNESPEEGSIMETVGAAL